MEGRYVTARWLAWCSPISVSLSFMEGRSRDRPMESPGALVGGGNAPFNGGAVT